MADNVQAGAAVGSGPIFATANLTFSGDSVQVPGGFSGILSGSEGAWTWTLVVGGAGAVTAGVQRVTLASDDPAVVALQVIDDWDESDRAKVNLIAGQAGIAGGAGVVGATVPRVTLASDDPAVVALQLIDNAISGAGFNITQFGGASVPLGAGVEGTALRVTVATDSTGVLSVDDNGGSLTIDNATLSVVGSGLEATALRVTIASDSTGVLSVDDNGGAITVDNGGTFAVQVDGAALTALQLIDNLVLAEDAVHNSGDPGVMALAVQKSADAGLAADGDYVPLQTDANGYLKVNIKAGAGSGGTASTDDAAFTAAAGSGTPMMGFVTADAVDSGDVGVVGMLANRQLKVTLYDSGGVELAVGGGTQYTEDAAAAANPVGNAINLVRADSLAAVTDANGDNVAARGTNNGELYVKHVDAIPVTDNGGALTVDGSLTSVGTVTTVSTVTTITNVVHVDDNSGSLTVDGTVTATIAAGATTIAKAEDAAHTTGDVGVMALSVRQDTAAALAGTDADYQPLITDASGRLHVATQDLTQNGSIAATGSNTFTIGDGVAAVAIRISGTWVGTIDFEGSVDATLWDPVYGVRAGVGIPYTQIDESLNDNIFRFTTAGFRQIRARFTRTSGTVTVAWRGSHSTSGIYVNFPLPPGTNAIGKLAANSGVDIGDVDVTSIVPGTGATNLGKAEDGAHTSGDVGVMALSVRQDTAAALGGTDADYQPLITDANGRLHVIAAIAATQTLATVTTVSTLTGGGVAHDSADSGNPVKIGAIATASLLGRTPVAAADRTDLVAGTDGALIVRNGTSLEDIISEQKTNTDGASTAMTGAFAATASQRIYLTDLIMANSSATNITVDIRDGSAGSVLATFPVPANGGVVHRFGTPLRFTAATAAAFDGSAAVTTLSVTMIGFKSKT